MSEQATAEWRGMESGRALDRVVAERLGWRIEVDQPGMGFLINPITQQYLRVFFSDEYQAWQDLLYDGPIPHYSTDANAALALPFTDEVFASMTIEDYKGKDLASIAIVPRDADKHVMIAYSGPKRNFAYNYCRAWLAWKDAE